MNAKKIVITGSPSTGKTSIIENIEKRGFYCFHEISRKITLEARAKGIPQLFVTDPLAFSKKILLGRLKQFEEASKIPKDIVFLDRGLPDVLAYLDGVGREYDTSFAHACHNNRYDMVFLLPPWQEIHTSDNERHEDFEEALRIHDSLERTYKHFGYEIYDVPKATVTERVDYVLSKAIASQ